MCTTQIDIYRLSDKINQWSWKQEPTYNPDDGNQPRKRWLVKTCSRRAPVEFGQPRRHQNDAGYTQFRMSWLDGKELISIQILQQARHNAIGKVPG